MKFILCDGELVSEFSSIEDTFSRVCVQLTSGANFFGICDYDRRSAGLFFGAAPDITVGYIVPGMPTFSLELEGKAPTDESKRAAIHAIALYLQRRYDEGKSIYEPNDIATILIEHLQPKEKL